MKKKIEKIIQEKLINPVLHSRAPVSEVSLGVAVGVFLGLTPTVGVQMYLAVSYTHLKLPTILLV